MTDTRISDAAVEASESAFASKEGWPYDIQMRAALEAALPHLHPQPAELSFDVDAMLAACVPGGSIVDPQVVADNIRTWAAHRKPAELAHASVLEQIAQQWDGCQYDAPGEMVDIGAAIRRAGERLSAEQAEQGVDAHTLWAMAQLAPGEGIEDGVRRIEKALAATGKQQPSTFDGGGEYYADQHGDGAWATYLRNGKGWVYNFGQDDDAEIRAKSVARELNRQVSAITARMQVGEQQGDAVDELIASWSRQAKERFEKNEFSVVAESLIICVHELKAALADRQPGAQMHLPPDGYYKIVYDDAEVPDESFARTGALDAALRRFEQISVRWNAHLFVRFANNTRDCTVPNAAPEQGVDLGQFRTQVAELLRMEFDLEVADPEDHRHDDGYGEADRIASKIAALIGQRDAAPGVG